MCNLKIVGSLYRYIYLRGIHGSKRQNGNSRFGGTLTYTVKQTNVQHFQVLHLTVPRTSTRHAMYGNICWCASGGLRTQFLEDFCYGCHLPIIHSVDDGRLIKTKTIPNVHSEISTTRCFITNLALFRRLFEI
jgi:hypothetical protein